MRLCIDPGHGGSDTGAKANGIAEADYNLRVAREVAMRIGRNHPDIEVFLTRIDDSGLGLLERGAMSVANFADLVLSIHCNAHKSRPDFHGMLCFHWPGNYAGRRVGNAIMRCAPKPLHKPGWSSIAATAEPGEQDDWLQRPRNVLAPHGATAVLAEIGYLTNEADAAALESAPVFDWLCYSILCGIAEYRRI